MALFSPVFLEGCTKLSLVDDLNGLKINCLTLLLSYTPRQGVDRARARVTFLLW